RAPEASQALSRALRLDPRDARAWSALGNAQWAQGQREGALQSWRRSLALQPNNPALAAFVQKQAPAPVPAPAQAAPEEESGPWLQRGLASLFTGLGVAMVVLL
ncbi:MAG: tetratricopeptide repeat protein, partial [Propionibacteriaceae bacterium]